MIEAYPLQWPIGYKRAANKTHAQFKTAFAKARDGIIYELKRMGATDIIISTNVPLKRDGLPYAVPFGSKNVTDDTGIAVYFTFNKQQKVICCDAYHTLDDNMQAINKAVEALRGIDRWKCSDIINQTFTGFKAIPENVETETWYQILGVNKMANTVQIKEAYFKKAKETHPDSGGNTESFNKVRRAYEQAMAAMQY